MPEQTRPRKNTGNRKGQQRKTKGRTSTKSTSSQASGKKPKKRRPQRKESAAEQLTALQAAVELVKRGHREMVPRLRELLTESPEVWKTVGDIARNVQRGWVRLLADGDDTVAESMNLYVESRQKELLGDDFTALEKAMVERIVTCELRVAYLEGHEVSVPGLDDTRLARARDERIERAEKLATRAMQKLREVQLLQARIRNVEARTPKPMSVLAGGGVANGKRDSSSEQIPSRLQPYLRKGNGAVKVAQG